MLFFSLIFVLHASLVFCVDIDDYFNIKAGDESVGGCDQVYGSQTGRAWIEQWWTEAQTLTQTGVAASDSYANDKATRANFLLFFGVKPDDAGSAQNNDPSIATNFQDMSAFFSEPAPYKGWIFCSDKWLEQQAMSDVAEDATGNPNPNGISIADMYQLPNKATGPQPFWSSDLKRYFVDYKKHMSEFCANKNNNLGGTSDYTSAPPGAITLCMTRIMNTRGVDVLGASEPVAGQSLQQFMSRGVSLYHELFHWVLGNAATDDVWSGIPGAVQMALQWEGGDESKPPAFLPENMAIFCEAQWLTTHTWPSGTTWFWDGKANARS